MLTDFYELTMANGLFDLNGFADENRLFRYVFPTKCPTAAAYAIMAGLEQLIDYLKDLHFTEEDIAFLRSKSASSSDRIPASILRGVFALPATCGRCRRARPSFPREPHRSPCAARSCRPSSSRPWSCWLINHPAPDRHQRPTALCRAAKAAGRSWSLAPAGHRDMTGRYMGQGPPISEDVSERHAPSASGISAVSHLGTMAHSWVQMYPSEYEAFRKYAEIYPDNCTLLVDTYNVLRLAYRRQFGFSTR